tara:strand:+ start:32401 stop:33096 length:696 start_codon:yes stop_codon:yes gene_type:complete
VTAAVETKIDEILQSVKNDAARVHAWDYHKTYMTACAQAVEVEGLWMEFGVYRGRTITATAENTTNIIYGFDSFEGLPEFWDGDNPQGVYSLGGDIPMGSIAGSNDENPGMYDSSPTTVIQPWPRNVRLVKGLFSDSLPPFLSAHPEPAAFINIDSDLYSSAKTVLEHLEDRFQNGTILTFDELCDYPTYRDHEIKAFAEFLLKTGYQYECIIHQDLANYNQACFRISGVE